MRHINNRTTDRHQYKLVPVYMYIKDKVNIVLFVHEQCWYGGLARACSARRWGSLYGYCDALVARMAHTFSSFWRSLSSLRGDLKWLCVITGGGNVISTFGLSEF